MNRLQNIWSFLFRTKARAAITIVVLLSLVFLGYRQFKSGTNQPSYQTAQAQKGTLINSVSASGTVSAGSSVNITTQATGVVNQVFVKDGDEVTAGQKIADITLDTNSLQKQTSAWASYQSAQNTLATANSKVNSLQSTLFAANQKFINDAVARDLATDDPTYIQENATWLQAESDYKNQQGVITQAQSALSSAWLSYVQYSSSITAPASGTVTGLSITPGLPIEISNSSNSSTSPSATLGTINLPQGQTQAIINLTQIDVTNVKIGQKVTLTLDAFPDKTFTGIVSAINTNGTVSSGVTSYPATITFNDAPSSIYPNMTVNATIITDIKDNVILVPSSAVQTSSGQPSVRVLRNNQPVSVNVTTNGSNDTETAISSGLNEGDQVIIGETTSGTSTNSTSSPFGNTRGFGGFGGGGGGRVNGRGG